MSGITLKIDIDDSGLQVTLEEIARRAEDLTPAMKAIGEHMIQVTQERFDLQKDPEGEPWPQSDWENKRIKKTLTETSRLRHSIIYSAAKDGVAVGTNVIYAAIHQFGGTIEPKTAKKLRFKIGDHWVFADKVEMPARPYLWFAPEDQEEAAATISDFLLGE